LIAVALPIIGILGFFVRVLPYEGTSAILGGFYPNAFVGMDFILRNGHILANGDLPVSSTFSQGIYYGTSDIFLFIFTTMAAIIGGAGDSQSLAQFLRGFVWLGTILFPLSVVFVFNSFAKAAGVRLRAATLMMAFALGTFLGWNVIYLSSAGEANAPYGWSLILIVVGLLVRPSQHVTVTRGLALGFASLSMTFYHTDAAVIFLVLLSWLVVQRRAGKRSLTVGMLACYTAAYLAYLLYVSVSFFGAYLSALAASSQTLFGGATHVLQSPGVFSIPLWWRLPLIASWAIVGGTYGTFLLMLRRRPKRTPGLVAASALIVAFPPIFVTFALFGLVEALGRITLYGFVFFVPVLAYLRTHFDGRRTAHGVAAVSLSILLLSGGLFVTTPTFASNTISYPEESAGLWLIGHSDSSTVVFTDYRLGSILTSNGWFSVIGLWSSDPPSKVLGALDAIYYGNSSEAAQSALAGYTSFSGHRPSFVFLSTGMSDSNIGISAGGVTFSAAPRDFSAKFNQNPNFAVVFDSGEAKVYMIETPGW